MTSAGYSSGGSFGGRWGTTSSAGPGPSPVPQDSNPCLLKCTPHPVPSRLAPFSRGTARWSLSVASAALPLTSRNRARFAPCAGSALTRTFGCPGQTGSPGGVCLHVFSSLVNLCVFWELALLGDPGRREDSHTAGPDHQTALHFTPTAPLWVPMKSTVLSLMPTPVGSPVDPMPWETRLEWPEASTSPHTFCPPLRASWGACGPQPALSSSPRPLRCWLHVPGQQSCALRGASHTGGSMGRGRLPAAAPGGVSRTRWKPPLRTAGAAEPEAGAPALPQAR